MKSKLAEECSTGRPYQAHWLVHPLRLHSYDPKWLCNKVWTVETQGAEHCGTEGNHIEPCLEGSSLLFGSSTTW